MIMTLSKAPEIQADQDAVNSLIEIIDSIIESETDAIS